MARHKTCLQTLSAVSRVRRLAYHSACLALWTTGGLTACGEDAGHFEPLDVRVTSPIGSPPPSYRVLVSNTNSQVWAQTCPGATQQDILQCTDSGVHVGAEARTGDITVKARGCVSNTVSAENAQSGKLTVALEAMPPLERNDDFATGFDVTDGDGVLMDLAVSQNTEIGPSYSVKFYITDLHGQPRVYLQNTRKHPLHYDFARLVLGVPGSVSDFEAATYHGSERSSMAGTLVYYPTLRFASSAAKNTITGPITVNFFPSDDLVPSQALLALRLLEDRIYFANLDGGDKRIVYLPAGERQQMELAQATADFARRDALWTTEEEIYSGLDLQILNSGLAYGTLRLLTPEDLASQVVSFTDIVVLTRLPNELSVVGGTITAELQTPLAHVNVASRARGTPNIALRNADTDARITSLLGKMVRFEVRGAQFSLDATTIEEAQAYWKSLTHEQFIPPSDVDYQGLPSFEQVNFADAIRFGAKAANLGELRQLLGDQAPTGFAVPFSAYDRYMTSERVTKSLCADAANNCIADGRAPELCQASSDRCSTSAMGSESLQDYAYRLMSDAELLANSQLREACLDGLVFLIEHGTVDEAFATQLDARVAEVFGAAQVRLRSSTNAEDLPGFSGAGLYRSVSAFASGERRASLLIREVWSSVWGWQAFEERQFWNIDSSAVRMGVAVNAAIDDEVANGVLVTQNIANPNVVGMYVNVQWGELSVTNPVNGALPEVFSILPAPGGGVQVARQQYSSLMPTAPILTDSEVAALFAAEARVQAHFAPLYGIDTTQLALDTEFKFHGANRAMFIKQARPYVSRTVLK